MRAVSSTDTSTRSAGPDALEHVDALGHFERVADGAAERRVHRGDDRFGPDPGRGADRHQRLGQLAGCRERLHERAAAGLDVEHERVDPLGDLLAHDRGADEGNALDRAGDVAQRVQLLVGRCDLRRSGRSWRSRFAAAPPSSRRSTGRRGSRGSLRACRACRRCGPDRGPTSSAPARRTPRPAAPGSSEVLSPTPPVLCLSTLTPGMSLRSTRTPEWTMASVSHAVSSAVIPRHSTAISQRRDLIVRHRAVRDAVDDECDLVAGKRAAVTLLENDVGGAHRPEYSGIGAGGWRLAAAGRLDRGHSRPVRFQPISRASGYRQLHDHRHDQGACA